jgi:hypothetical protein
MARGRRVPAARCGGRRARLTIDRDTSVSDLEKGICGLQKAGFAEAEVFLGPRKFGELALTHVVVRLGTAGSNDPVGYIFDVHIRQATDGSPILRFEH